MEQNQYKIVAKEVKGINIVGVTIENSEGNKKNISISDATKLARSDKITNATAKFDVINSEYVLDVEGGMNNLEYSDRTKGLSLVLLGRLLNDNDECIGYKAQDSKGKTYKLSIAKIWEMTEQGAIKGVKAKICSKGKILESTDDCDLSRLPVFKN